MSKLSFRAKALDAGKPLPLYRKDEITGKQDYTGHNRAVPQMPTGMEKEEESEHHLQRAISAQQVFGDKHAMVIPVPEAEVSPEIYNTYYKNKFRIPRGYVTAQSQTMILLENHQPDYDMDSEDEEWMNKHNTSQIDPSCKVTPDQFETVMDGLEKACETQILTLSEVKVLFKEEGQLMDNVYQHWFSKRERQKGTLTYQVRQEKRDGSSTNDSYVAFRRRTEKMQTRKNRKNDEASYSKMVKLRREFVQVVALINLIRKREACKYQTLEACHEEFEKRCLARDYDGKLLRQAVKDASTNNLTAKAGKNHQTTAARANSIQYRKKRHVSGAIITNDAKKSVTAASISRGQIESRDYPPSKKVKKKRAAGGGGGGGAGSGGGGSVGAAPNASGNLIAASRADAKRRNDFHRLNAPGQTGASRKQGMLSPTSLQQQQQVSKASPHMTSPPTNLSHPRDTPSPYPALSSPLKSYEYTDDSEELHASSVTNDEGFMNRSDSTLPSEGIFTFRRTLDNDTFHESLSEEGDWPWCSDRMKRYVLTTLTVPDRTVGFVRRRMGRGGRILLDRAHHKLTRKVEQLDLNPLYHHHYPPTDELCDLRNEILEDDSWVHCVASSITNPSTMMTNTGDPSCDDKPSPTTPITTPTTAGSSKAASQCSDHNNTTVAPNSTAPQTAPQQQTKVAPAMVLIPKEEVKPQLTTHSATRQLNTVTASSSSISCATNAGKRVASNFKLMTAPANPSPTANPVFQMIKYPHNIVQAGVGATSASTTTSSSTRRMFETYKEQPVSIVIPATASHTSVATPSTIAKTCADLASCLQGYNAMKIRPTTSSLNNGGNHHHHHHHQQTTIAKCSSHTTTTASASPYMTGVKLSTSQQQSNISTLSNHTTTTLHHHPNNSNTQQRASVAISKRFPNVVRINPSSLISFPQHAANNRTTQPSTHLAQSRTSNPVNIKVNLAASQFGGGGRLVGGLVDDSTSSSSSSTATATRPSLDHNNLQLITTNNKQQQRAGARAISLNISNMTTAAATSSGAGAVVNSSGAKMLRLSHNSPQLFSVSLTQAGGGNQVSSNPVVVGSKSNLTMIEQLRQQQNSNESIVQQSLLANQLVCGSSRSSTSTVSRLSTAPPPGIASSLHTSTTPKLLTNIVTTNTKPTNSRKSISTPVVAAPSSASSSAVQNQTAGGSTTTPVKNSKSSRPMEVT